MADGSAAPPVRGFVENHELLANQPPVRGVAAPSSAAGFGFPPRWALGAWRASSTVPSPTTTPHPASSLLILDWHNQYTGRCFAKCGGLWIK